MTAAMLIALLLQSGACAESHFQGPDGTMLSVVVCPMLTPKEDENELPPGKRQRS